MSTSNDGELFEGLQIMSPEELNSAVSTAESKEETKENVKASAGESEEFEFLPVESEKGEGAYENKSDS